MFKLARSLIFLAFFLIIILLTLVSASPKVSAQTNNKTNFISIEATTNPTTETVNLTYKILERFNNPSRGIFLSLPKNQDGVITDYTVLSAQRAINTIPLPTSNSLDNLDTSILQNLELQTETYNQFIELDQLRLRVGKEDKYLPEGLYYYEIKITATYVADLNYNFTVLGNWGETIDKIEVYFNGQNLCNGDLSCAKGGIVIPINPQVATKPHRWSWLYFLWPYALATIIIGLLTFLGWYFWARDPHATTTSLRPRFEPPEGLLPWQASYLLSESKLLVKDTLLAYILWLNHNKIITLQPTQQVSQNKSHSSDSLQLTIQTVLPTDVLPPKFNQTIELISQLGFKAGVARSKINQGEDGQGLNDFVGMRLATKYYDQRPFSPSIIMGIVLTIAIVGLLGGYFWFLFLQSTFLLGNSFIPVLLYTGLATLFGVNFILYRWSKPNRRGVASIEQVRAYKYYLESAEKLKLDFANNPTEGVQYYLKSVPYAASFGILPKFNRYFGSMIPDTKEISLTSELLSNYSNIIFYVPSGDLGLGDVLGAVAGSIGDGGSW